MSDQPAGVERHDGHTASSHSPMSETKIHPKASIAFAGGTLLLDGIDAATIREVFPPDFWREDSRVGLWRADALRYSAAVSSLRGAGIAFSDAVPAWHQIAWPRVNTHALRAEQRRGADAWCAAGRCGVIVMPTGTGKTDVALDLMRQVMLSTLVVAPVRDLMYQWHRRILAGLGYDSGIVGDNIWNVRPVTCTTYDSACIHAPRIGNRFALIVFDECHHLRGPIRSDAARMSAAPMRLGLTATWEPGQGRHARMSELIGPVVYDLPLGEVAGATLADYQVVRIPVHLASDERARYRDCSAEVRRFRQMILKEKPGFTWQDLPAEAAKNPDARRALLAWHTRESIEDRAIEKLRVLEDLFRLHAGTPMIVFTGSNKMAREVSRRFLLPCLLHHCGKRERAAILAGFREGTYPVLVANEVLDEGVDLPAAKVAVVLGGHASTRQAKQRLGRILRRHGGCSATLYEVVCAETREEERSRERRKSDAYTRTRHRRV